MSETSTYNVQGMTCGHCVTSVSDELSHVEGVTDVDVDLSTGNVTVISAGPLERSVVQSAVEEAGYELAP